jgi:homoserine dehydrogenase
MKPVINVGIVGLGIVGCGTYQLLHESNDLISQKVGSRVAVKRIADIDLDRPRPISFDRSIATTDAYELVGDPEIDIVVELTGTVHPAYEIIMAALENGKQVVTANKDLIAKEGHDLLVAAGERKLDLCFEGSVAGGIPIIRPLKICLAGNHIREIKGIVNGTTNYILTRMTAEGKGFEEILADAQAHGYAEPNPTNDVDGHDAANKIAILGSIGFASRVDVAQVYREGIRNIAQSDIAYARDLGYCIKLLAIAKEIEGRMDLRVHPTMIPFSHPLASVNDVYNAIYVSGDPVGNLMFYGRGAGAEATSSAVVGDIIDAAININHRSTGRIGCTCFEAKPMHTMDDLRCRHYIRMETGDHPGVLAAISNVFGEQNVSIQAVTAKSTLDRGAAESIWVTHEAPEPSVRKSLELVESLPEVTRVANWIRVED